MIKNPPANAGDRDTGLIPGLERSPGEGNGNPLQYSCLENPMERGNWRATVHGVEQSWTQLKWLSRRAASSTLKVQHSWFFQCWDCILCPEARNGDGSSGRIRKAFTQCSLPWMLPGLFSPSVWPCASGPQCSHPYCRNKNSLTRHGFWEGRIEWWMGTGLWELCKEHPFLKNQGRWLSGTHFLFALDLTCLIFSTITIRVWLFSWWTVGNH